MRFLPISCFVISILTLGCSSGSPSGSSVVPPVQAQSGYSNASLNGTYALSSFSFATGTGVGNNSTYYTALGTLKLDGSGSVSSGTLTEYSSSTSSVCSYSVTGIYSLQSTGAGTATLNLTSTGSGCASTDKWQLTLVAANSGTTVHFARSDSGVASGSATKQ
jgi:hypothetical protein